MFLCDIKSQIQIGVGVILVTQSNFINALSKVTEILHPSRGFYFFVLLIWYTHTQIDINQLFGVNRFSLSSNCSLFCYLPKMSKHFGPIYMYF